MTGDRLRSCDWNASARDVGLRIGTVRRPPRGVPRASFSSDDWYNVWFPNLAPGLDTIRFRQQAETPAQWSVFAKKYKRDMDFNGHMRNTAFLDKSADIRLMFFAEHGLPIDKFLRLGIGPVVRKDDIEYFREIRLLEDMRVTLAAAGLSDDGARFLMRNEFWRADDSLAARVTSSGGWLDHRARKLVVPPEVMQAALREIPRTNDFQVLPPLRPRERPVEAGHQSD